MTTENYLKAIKIIAASNSPTVSFNTPIHDNYSNVYKILIHNSNSSLINELVKAGYSLHMTPKGLAVDHWGIDPGDPESE